MQITIKTSKATIVAVLVRHDGRRFRISKNNRLIYTFGLFGDFSEISDLPPGQYQLLGKPEEITEEVAGEIVEQWDSGAFEDYERYLARVKTALESFLSLLTANKVEGNDWIIVKLIDK